MSTTKNDPYDPRFDMSLLKLTPDEQQFEDDFEAGHYKRVENFKEMKEMLIQAAKNHRKSKMISIRVQETDLTQIKVKAKDMGIPYQKLINMLIHMFTQDKIVLPK